MQLTPLTPKRSAAQPIWRMEAARAQDVPALVRLMGSVVPDCAPQTVWELPWRWSAYQVLRDQQDEIIAAGSLQQVDVDKVELRGIVVDPAWRGSGAASALLRGLIKRAQDAGKTPVCITAKPDFFRRFGFESVFQVWRREWTRARPDRKAAQRIAMQCSLVEGVDYV